MWYFTDNSYPSLDMTPNFFGQTNSLFHDFDWRFPVITADINNIHSKFRSKPLHNYG